MSINVAAVATDDPLMERRNSGLCDRRCGPRIFFTDGSTLYQTTAIPWTELHKTDDDGVPCERLHVWTRRGQHSCGIASQGSGSAIPGSQHTSCLTTRTHRQSHVNAAADVQMGGPGPAHRCVEEIPTCRHSEGTVSLWCRPLLAKGEVAATGKICRRAHYAFELNENNAALSDFRLCLEPEKQVR